MKNVKLSLLFVAAAALFTQLAMAKDDLPKAPPAEASSVVPAAPEVITVYKLAIVGKGDKEPVIKALGAKLEKNQDVLNGGKCEASKQKRDIKNGVALTYACTSPNDKTDSFFRSLVVTIVPSTKKTPEISLRTTTDAVKAQGATLCVKSTECCPGSFVLCKGWPRNQPCTTCPQ